MKVTSGTIADIPRRQALERPQEAALVFEGRTTTWLEFDESSSRVANGLIAEGIEPAAHVGYLGKSCDRYFEILYGAAKAGAVLVPINWRLAPAEVEFILGDGEVEVLFVAGEFAPVVEKLDRALDRLRRVVVIEPGASRAMYEAWRDGFPASDPGRDEQAAAIVVVYTSGTTGSPKGAVLTHRGLFNGLEMALSAQAEHMVWTPEEAALIALPVFHVGGISYSFTGLAQGCTLVIHAEFSAGDVLAAVGRYDIPTIALVPTMTEMILNDPAAATTDFSRLRYVLYGAAPMTQELLRRAIDAMGCQFVQTYGMTESMYVTCLPPEDHGPDAGNRMLSVGRPFPGVSIRILDPSGREMPQGTNGEIAVRSPALLKEYWKQPEATAAAVADGWFRTGDGGYLDGDGYLFLTERINDMIVSGGENVYPAEVEQALRSHPSVHDVAVVGVPDIRWGEVPKAFVVLHAGESLDAGGLKAHAAARLASYKVPKYFEPVGELPRTALGKVLRRQLRGG